MHRIATPLCAVFGLCLGHLSAAPQTGGPYTITSGGLASFAGSATGSTLYAGRVVGTGLPMGTGSAGGYELASGSLPQLPAAVSATATAVAPTVDEGGEVDVSLDVVFDDGTHGSPPASEVHWQVLAGPLTSIIGGRAVGGIVYADTEGSFTGRFDSISDSATVTVLNVNEDDFGSYAGDSLDDDWQVQWFGFDNPLAAPNQNPDGDPHDNRFECLANLNPTDASSVFRLRLEPAAGGLMSLVFSPLAYGRNYTVKWSPNLGPDSWQNLTNTNSSDNGTERTVTDLSPVGSRKFYRVEITKP